MKNKKEIRVDIQSLFDTTDREELERKSETITAELITYIEQGNYKHVCVYEHMDDEVNTHNIIQYLRKKGINVYTPQMIGEVEMILIDEDYEHHEKEIDLFIIPGRAFTYDGKRLGRGKGYYDRFLAQKTYKKSQKLGICFDFQLFKEIPTQKHDILMNKIITND